MTKLELLAPARDLQTGIDAVNCGADAVYIGAEMYGARSGAANTVADIGRLAQYAHRYRAKVYAAVNTIFTGGEINHAARLIARLWDAGADAAIIQDMGLLEAGLPPIPLFASTQCHNSTPEKVLFLEKAGFSRVILARELSLEEIKAVRAATAVELEAFVHGALCVCYSGQCYLSHELGGRSGNRGECAQPCRKAWAVTDGSGARVEAGPHPLSLKDLNLSRRLAHLAAAGVTSFKIEGRLKDRAYVRNIVAHYRRELDKLAAKGYGRTSCGKSFPGFEPDPAKTFNRGYTEYFLDGNPLNAHASDTPKFKGEPLGRAFDVKEGSFKVQGAARLTPGDGIAFSDKEGRLAGGFVHGVTPEGRVRADNLRGMDSGTLVYRNLDSRFIASVTKADPRRRLALRLEFSDYEGGFTLKASDELGAEAEAKLRGVKSAAQKPEQALDTITKQLSKLGESAWHLEKLDVKLSRPYFIPVSALNDLRRDALAALGEAAPPYERAQRQLEPTDHPYPARVLDYTGNVLNPLAAKFYRRHGVKETGMAAEGGADLAGKPVMTLRCCPRRVLGLCRKGKAVEPLYLTDEEGDRLRLEFDCAACVARVYLERRGLPAAGRAQPAGRPKVRERSTRHARRPKEGD